MTLQAYPKIFALGQSHIKDIFDSDVEITEKIDGSQIVFGKINGELHIRSKGAYIHDYTARSESDLFYPAIQHIMSIKDKLEEGWAYYGETLKKPKHNTLAYDSVPKGHIALYGIQYDLHSFLNHSSIKENADELGVDVVPLLYYGKASPEMILTMMDRVSVLGGQKMEGVVVKNYEKEYLIGSTLVPLMIGKYVSEEFKEVHHANWTKENTGVGKWQLLKQSFRTEARWNKAVQHIKERGELEESPRDIGKLIAEVKQDIISEEKENIKEFLWKEFKDDLLREATKELPEWYKEKLLIGE